MSESTSQFNFAARRCRKCDWPCVGSGISVRGVVYICRACGWVGEYSRRACLLRWVFQLTFFSVLFRDPQRRARSRERRMVALHAIHRIYEQALREKIIKLVGLW